MKLRVSLFAAAALAAAGSAVILATPSASAIQCPPGTTYRVIKNVAGREIGACVPKPYPPCDPGPCSPPATAVPYQD